MILAEVYFLILIFALLLSGYTFLFKDWNNYTHIITGYFSGVIYFIAGYYAYIGIGFSWSNSTAAAFKLTDFEYHCLGLLFVIFGVIMFLYSTVLAIYAVRGVLGDIDE